jgi:hypothetical protein
VVVRLQEQHVDAVEDRLEADLAAGLHADLVDEIRSCSPPTRSVSGCGGS